MADGTKKYWEARIRFEGWPIEGEDLAKRVKECIETHPTQSFKTASVKVDEVSKIAPTIKVDKKVIQLDDPRDPPPAQIFVVEVDEGPEKAGHWMETFGNRRDAGLFVAGARAGIEVLGYFLAPVSVPE